MKDIRRVCDFPKGMMAHNENQEPCLYIFCDSLMVECKKGNEVQLKRWIKLNSVLLLYSELSMSGEAGAHVLPQHLHMQNAIG